MCGNPSVADGRNYKKSDKCNVKIITILFVWTFNKKHYPINHIENIFVSIQKRFPDSNHSP